MKRVILLILLLLTIMSSKVVDTTIIKEIYEIDNVMYYDIIKDNNIYEKVYVEDL